MEWRRGNQICVLEDYSGCCAQKESKGYVSGYRKGWLEETRIQLNARSLD